MQVLISFTLCSDPSELHTQTDRGNVDVIKVKPGVLPHFRHRYGTHDPILFFLAACPQSYF